MSISVTTVATAATAATATAANSAYILEMFILRFSFNYIPILFSFFFLN